MARRIATETANDGLKRFDYGDGAYIEAVPVRWTHAEEIRENLRDPETGSMPDDNLVTFQALVRAGVVGFGGFEDKDGNALTMPTESRPPLRNIHDFERYDALDWVLHSLSMGEMKDLQAHTRRDYDEAATAEGNSA